ncbi:MAG: cytochrome c biogenesis protein ResB [Bacteroidaceae bacterium]|nr:cytochrome c biogenesis protein ResB [Bacteroidaceae bacterium]
MQWLILYLMVFAGIQCLTGNVDPEMFAFPVGSGLGVAAIAFLFVLDREKGQSNWMRRFRSPHTACWLLALVAGWCIVGGCMPAAASFSTSWPFVALLVVLLAHLTLVIIHRLHHFSFKRDGAFMALHAGLWLALFSGVVGAGDTQEMKAIVNREEETIMAVGKDGCIAPLGYKLQLQDFTVETSEADGSPTQYRAQLLMDGAPVIIEVNSPLSVNFGEDIYLTNFEANPATGVTTHCMLTIVHQPWKYPMLLGILLLLAGVAWYLKMLGTTSQSHPRSSDIAGSSLSSTPLNSETTT